VRLVPADDRAAKGVLGRTDPDGICVLNGVKPGRYAVVVIPKETKNGEQVALSAAYADPRKTPLTTEVKKGEKTLSLKLKGKVVEEGTGKPAGKSK
jgi:hypothetical protein